MQQVAEWVAATSASLWVQEYFWLVPLLQTIHILAVAMVLSSVAMISLRILRVARSTTITQTAQRFVPWIWTGLSLQLMTGVVLIVGEPKRTIAGNPAFYVKMLLLALAVAGALVFQSSVRRDSAFWENATKRSKLKSVLVFAYFALWCNIVFAGRWISYLHGG
jgi:hypothetical protein